MLRLRTNQLRALGRKKRGERNKTEAAYEATLAYRQKAGEIVWFEFEAIKLRLADNTFLTVDFAVLTKDGEMQLHDVKGSKAIIEDDAIVKMKVAAAKFPFAFYYALPRDYKQVTAFHRTGRIPEWEIREVA